MVISVNSRGTLTLPSEIRKQLDIKEGDFFDIKVVNGEIVITPVFILPKIKLSGKGIKKEKIASKEISERKIKTFTKSEELIKELNED